MEFIYCLSDVISRNFAEYLETNNQLLRDHATGLGVYITVISIVFTVLAVLIPSKYSELREQIKQQRQELKNEIEKQRQLLESVKEKMKIDFSNKTDELIKNEKEIELKMQFKLFMLLNNHFVANFAICTANCHDHESNFSLYLTISYVLFYELLKDSVPLLNSSNHRVVVAQTINQNYRKFCKIQPMIDVYKKMKNGNEKYGVIYNIFKQKYQFLLDPDLILFLKEAAKKENTGTGGK